MLVLAKSGLSDAEITEMRDAMIATALMSPVSGSFRSKGRSEMKIISSEAHAALDYLTVVIFALVPTVIRLSGAAAIVSYVLAVVHLSMTLVTEMPFSLVAKSCRDQAACRCQISGRASAGDRRPAVAGSQHRLERFLS